MQEITKMIELTQSAADQVHKIQDAKSELADKFLRIAVVGGGCSGNKYQLGFDIENDSDSKFDSNGVTILMDPNSAQMLNGMEIDFVEGLEGSSFVFNNPNATQGCGCGKSFS